STNSFTTEQGSSIYNQNVVIGSLVLAESDKPSYPRREGTAENEQLLGRLAEEFVHQVGNPLCALKGFITLAAQHDSEFAAAWTPLIQQELEQIEKSLKVFSIMAGSAYEMAEEFDLRDLAAQFSGSFTPLAIAQGVWLTLPFPTCPLPVRVTSEKLGLAITELLQNALEASRPGEVIDLRLQRVQGHAYLTITNSTAGPLTLDLTSIKPFSTTKPGHSGLGLWLAARVIESYGGKLKIESDRDLLVTTTISLPLSR
ncbi:MAG: sensor histidine kinase, partial [Methylocystaceae bacterium]